jgi:AcrR family transcriptional regulator
MSSVAPLRPGPADPDAAARIRERILDAATECLLDQGLDARLHAAIAERAGISRPTVYKYVGDQSAIVAAILERELDRFFAAAVPVLRRSDDLAAHLVDAIAFVVDYGRGHALLQKALREHPELILPALTTQSGGLVDRVVGLFEEQLGRALSRSPESGLDARTAAEWGYRVVISLVTTPTPELDRVGTHAYVDGLVRLMGVTSTDADPT